MRDWPPCLPVQRDGGRQSRPGVNPFISALTVTRCPVTFPGVWPQLRDILSTSRSVGRGTGAFIYALSADETRDVLAAPRHTITALFFCRFKCPRPPRRQPHFHSNADRAYNTLHLASKVMCQRGGASPPLETPGFVGAWPQIAFLHLCPHPIQNPKKRRRPAYHQGLICAVSLFGLRAEMGENA